MDSALPTEPPDHGEWPDLKWSAWMPLMAAHPLALAQLPAEAGLYRVRLCGNPDALLWSGWAESSIRVAVERLSRQVHLPVEPYDDVRTPALMLWTMRTQSRVGFEVSGAAAHRTVKLVPALPQAIQQ